MGVLASCSLFLIPLLMISMIPATTCVYWYHICDNTTTFAPNSTYQTNLNAVFLSLSSNATNSKNSGFYYTTAGRDTANTVYGSFLCRGDDTPSACRDCVATATKTDLPKTYCPNEKEAVIWYDECTVRYSYNDFYCRMDKDPKIVFLNTGNVDGNEPNFIEVFSEIMNKVTSRASIGEGSPRTKKFATGKASVTLLETLYGMAQCTPDLSQIDCDQCLGIAYSQIPIVQGARLFQPSCFVRYELYSFYTGDPMVTLSLPPPDSTTNTRSPPPPTDHAGKRVQLKIAIPISIGVLVIVMVLILAVIARKKRKNNDVSIFERVDGDDPTIESLQCGLEVLKAATNNFDDDNMIGKGGFGVVYKGTLPNGKHIAIKKLFLRSLKVEEEFKNEMKVVARLQHKNLVKLLAFCLDRGERLLVFEYVANKSLDYFIFEAEKSEELDWRTRFNIIEGIARGLLYLHEDSRLTIIHRDLKPSNILLEYDMKPKIADFGMARIFGMDQTPSNLKQVAGKSWQRSGADQTHQSTSNIGGTLGYMAPDYIKTRRFSVKTDVYSFGVIVLEIISGKRNRTFYQSGLATDLLSYAWTQLKEGTPLKLIDTRLGGSYIATEVIRCIHLGLLCVQNDPNARPSMWDVVYVMLNTSLVDDLPLPQLPPVFPSTINDDESSPASYQGNNNSINEVSITEQHPR